ncbi:MAG: ABC transporter ATP-binding protein [Proteobacteria bacterium]|nr:ABC transporter ATP-binding protein [Pseudomonadota bacterium]
MSTNTVIETSDMDKIFPVGGEDFYALKKINLAVDEGEFTGIIGPSGSGKTTLLNIMGSLDKPSHGQVSFMGNDITHLAANKSATLRSEGIGFIFQTYNLLPVYTVYENLELPLILLKMSSVEKKKAIMESLEWVGLTEKKNSKPSQLSGGQCQRVAIARAMVKKPRVILADEPTANLDSENSHIILKTMEKINRESKTTFIFSTHDDKVIGYLKRKITLVDGSIQNDETF